MVIVQVTDCHIVAEPGSEIYGTDTFTSLRAVLTEALKKSPDVILATGDLSEDGSDASYERLRHLFLETEVPVYVVPGNHDSMKGIDNVLLGASIKSARFVDIDAWRIIFLDSKVDGEAYGYLAERELAHLANALAEDAERPAVVCLHHSPTKPCPSSGCHLRNEDEFLELLNRHENARVVLAGHAHLELTRQVAHTTLLTTPASSSRCWHAQPGQTVDHEDFWGSHKFDPRMRGFRVLTLQPEGRFTTEVSWTA